MSSKKATTKAKKHGSGPQGFRSTVTMPQAGSQWPGTFTVMARSAVNTWEHLVPLLVIVLIYGLTSFGDPPANIRFADLLIFSARQVLLSVLLLASAWPVYALLIADGKEFSVGDWLRQSARHYASALLVTALTVLIIMSTAFLLFLPLLLVLPWISMAIYVAVDPRREPVGALQAFRESYRLTRRHKMLIWYIYGAMFLIILLLSVLFAPLVQMTGSPVLPVITKALASAVTVIASCALASLYRWLQRAVVIEG